MELDAAQAHDAIPREEVDHFCSLLIYGLQVCSDPEPTLAYLLKAPAALPQLHAAWAQHQPLCSDCEVCWLRVLQACSGMPVKHSRLAWDDVQKPRETASAVCR